MTARTLRAHPRGGQSRLDPASRPERLPGSAGPARAAPGRPRRGSGHRPGPAPRRCRRPSGRRPRRRRRSPASRPPASDGAHGGAQLVHGQRQVGDLDRRRGPVAARSRPGSGGSRTARRPARRRRGPAASRAHRPRTPVKSSCRSPCVRSVATSSRTPYSLPERRRFRTRTGSLLALARRCRACPGSLPPPTGA